ncbi:MAG TPA: carboxypeptidase regulatory-like domain-containing protein [Pirellulales bacterium]|nr:carboxypeptidase regulatory-like domain-containing protein [Pirellulales bacterium]
MHALTGRFSAALSSSWAQLALDVTIKATVLLLLAVLAAFALRRSSAAVRHRVWCLTFAGLLLLPALSAGLPEWRLAVLPQGSALAYSSPLAPREESVAPAWRNEPANSLAQRQAPGDFASRDHFFADRPPFVTPGGLLAEREDYYTPAIDAETQDTLVAREPHRTFGPLGLTALWLLGTMAAAAPLGVGLLRNYLLRRHALPVAEVAWTGLLDELRGRLSLRRHVALYETRAALMPMTWGMLAPIVMLPHAAREWTERLRRFVLLHELAHVKRCDIGFQMLARLACALYWFHPLAWYALRRLRIERELACDDCVVQAGERPSDYAAELLAIARNYRPLRLAAVVPMAQTSNLEHRIRALFDRACSHLPISPRAARLLMLGTAVIVTSIAVIRLAPRAAAEAEEVAPSKTEGPDPKPIGTEAAPVNSEEPAAVRGTVFMPDGQPGAGVVVYARLPSSEKTPQIQAKTDDAGQFRLALPQVLFNEQDGSKVEILVYAVANGFAHDWTYIWGQTTDDVVLRLSKETAIEGRILNAEGRPLAGVELQVDDVARYRDNGMQLLFDDVSQGRNILREYSHWGGTLPGQPEAVKTGADGRFRIAGLSTDDVAKIKVRGSDIRHTTFEATAALRDTIRGPVPPAEPLFPPRPGRVLYGSPFDYIAEPARRIHGVVRDRRTGAPVPRAKVRCWDATTAEAESDELGCFILEGCAKQPQYVVSIEPAPEGPAYFPATLTIADEAGLKPFSRYFELVEGIALRGRIVDSGTGRPLEATIHYAPLYLNAHVADLFEQHVDPYTHSRSEPDGSFRIVVAPGPGVLGIGFPSGAFEQYLSIGVGYDDVVKLFEQSPEHRSLAHSPELQRGLPDSLPTARPAGLSFISQTGHARMVLISPDRQKLPEPLEVRLVRGRTLQGRLIDPDGQPLTGATAHGLYITAIRAQVISGSKFTVHAVGSDDEREISFEHQGRRLGACRAIGTGESEPITVRLEPYGGATGRVVDEQGGPVEGMHVWFYPVVSKGMQRGREIFAITDDEGRFKTDELIAGQQYEVSRSEPGAMSRRLLSLDKFSVDSGQTRDLGDLVLGSPAGKPIASAEKSAPVVADNSAPEKQPTGRTEVPGNQPTLTLRGRVLDPRGKPQAGARVRVIHVDTESITWVVNGRLLAESKTNADGAFAIEVLDAASHANRDHFVESSMVVLADSPSQGFDWAYPQRGGGPLTLQLVEDAMIEGRVLNLEARPVAGVRVSVGTVSGGASNLGAWIEKAKSNPVSLDPNQMARPIKDRNNHPGPTVAYFPGNKTLQLDGPELMPSAITDREGRFRLAGLGRDRQVRLQLDGAGIARTWLYVVTHDMPPVPYPGYDPRFRVQTCFGRRFDLTAEPEQPITGVIRDADSGEPLPGVEVRLTRYADSLLFVESFLAAITDDQGRYVLRGVPKPNHPEQAHCLRLMPAAGEPYFRTEVNPPKKEGLGPVSFDVPLKRAIRLRGRVGDEATGDPIRGFVAYYPFLTNKRAADFPNFNAGMHSMGNEDWYAIDQDGQYEIPALPGRGVVVFAAEQNERYGVADGADAIAGLHQQDPTHLNIYHLVSMQLTTAVREVNLSAGGVNDPIDIQVRPLSVARLDLVDPQGQPLVGAVNKHLAPARMGRSYSIAWSYDPLPSSTIEIVGPRDTARTAMFLHRERRLAGSVRLSPDRDPPRQIVLHPCATLSGRVVDRSGKPVPRLHCQVHAAPRTPDEKYADREDTLDHLQTDADGQFHLDDVPPGLSYVLSAIRGAESLDVTTQEVQPGETLDLGDVVLKASETGGKAAALQATQTAASRPTRDTSRTEKPRTSAAKSVANKSTKPLSHSIVLYGRVLLPDGGPAEEARVQVIGLPDFGMKAWDGGRFEVASQADGTFALLLPPDSKFGTRRWFVIATKEGYGLSWSDLPPSDDPADVTLKLPRELSIEGRIIDLEGKPVADLEVRVDRVQHFANGDPRPYLESLKEEKEFRFPNWHLHFHGLGAQSPVAAVRTDQWGRFRLIGIGQNQLVELDLIGEDVEHAKIEVLTYPLEQPLKTPDRLPHLRPVYGPRFTHALRPSRPIIGTVTDAKTGAAIEGVRVTAFPGVDTVFTDAAGRFALLGCPKADDYRLFARPPEGAPYLEGSATIVDTPGLEGLEAKLRVFPAVPLSGRVADRATGRPVSALVMYWPVYPNAHVVEGIGGFAAGGVGKFSQGYTDADGKFTVPVLPGAGFLGVNVADGRRFKPAEIDAAAFFKRQGVQYGRQDDPPSRDSIWICFAEGNGSPMPVSQFQGAALLNVPEDAEGFMQDIEVETKRDEGRNHQWHELHE